ncbi:MAG: hypothetical protein IPG32_13620 [Saprospirales bacterium]|nr:hypothetical protein [Saprospirales bacterium]
MIQHSMVTKSIERAQKKVEENNFGIRKRLLEYDDVMNIQREAIYKKRANALSGERLSVDLNNMFQAIVASQPGGQPPRRRQLRHLPQGRPGRTRGGPETDAADFAGRTRPGVSKPCFSPVPRILRPQIALLIRRPPAHCRKCE